MNRRETPNLSGQECGAARKVDFNLKFKYENQSDPIISVQSGFKPSLMMTSNEVETNNLRVNVAVPILLSTARF